MRGKHRGSSGMFFIDEVLVKINCKQRCFGTAVDQDGEAVDAYLQAKRHGQVTKRFVKRLLGTMTVNRGRSRAR